jgi:hypothetical protein
MLLRRIILGWKDGGREQREGERSIVLEDR